MYRIKKHFIIVAGIAVVIMIISVFIFTVLTNKKMQPPQVSAEELPYQIHLETFLEDSGLTSVRKEKDGFVYYELRDAGGDRQGFVFLGKEEGYGGPIRLFVKTDTKGIIQRVYVWEHRETPVFVVGLGEFLDTFANYRIDEELKWQTDVHGLTGATVTAESIIRGVRKLGIRAKEKEIYDVP